MRSTKPDQTFTQDLSAGALSFTSVFTQSFRLDQIIINFSEAVSETITITLDAKKGANYDTVLAEVVLVSESAFVWRPQGQSYFVNGDQIKVECTQGGASGVVYGTLKSSEIGG